MPGLHWAIVGGQFEIVKLLVDRGAVLETRNRYGGTALGQALWSAINGDAAIDYTRIIELLLERGAEAHPGHLEMFAQLKSRNPRAGR